MEAAVVPQEEREMICFLFSNILLKDFCMRNESRGEGQQKQQKQQESVLQSKQYCWLLFVNVHSHFGFNVHFQKYMKQRDLKRC